MDTAMTIIWLKGWWGGMKPQRHSCCGTRIRQLIWTLDIFLLLASITLGHEHSGCLSYILQQKTTVLVLAMVDLLHLVLCHAGIFVVVAGRWKVSPLVFHAAVIFVIYLSVPYGNLEPEEKVASFFSIHYLQVHAWIIHKREILQEVVDRNQNITFSDKKKKKTLENIA